jgi:hypothetical protein
MKLPAFLVMVVLTTLTQTVRDHIFKFIQPHGHGKELHFLEKMTIDALVIGIPYFIFLYFDLLVL